MRVKVIFSPGGDPPVGRILTVSDAQGRRMLVTGRVELVTDPPVSAGTTTTGEPGPVGREILAAAGPSGEVVATGPAEQPPAATNDAAEPIRPETSTESPETLPSAPETLPTQPELLTVDPSRPAGKEATA